MGEDLSENHISHGKVSQFGAHFEILSRVDNQTRIFCPTQKFDKVLKVLDPSRLDRTERALRARISESLQLICS
jgi:hypothetical protein